MDEKYFRNNFPLNSVIPESLMRLFHYQETNFRGPKQIEYSGLFSLSDEFGEYDTLLYISPKIISYFAPFGGDADGSVYAFWMYDDFPLDKAPIVFIGKNWAGNTILANSFEEFLALLSLGIEELGYVIHFPPDWPKKPARNAAETANFREWLASELGILVPTDPAKIVIDAKESHPDFDRWIEEKTGYPPEEMLEKYIS